VFDAPALGATAELGEELDAGFRFALDLYLDGVAGLV
jgi:hypothetical protein